MVSPETAMGTRPRSAMLLRGSGFAVAIVLGGLAVWLIATSGTVKAQRIGALSGMWGVLVGAYSIFGARRHDDPIVDAGTALELRQSRAIARSEDVAWQREFQARLEALLRREVQEGVSRELAGLRHEVASLRNEILEKVGGQLRMERTETTRLFGSNLEALQREVRLLKVAQLGDTGTIDTIDVTTYEPPPARMAGLRERELPRRVAESTPEPPGAAPAEPARVSGPAPEPEWAEAPGRSPAELLRPSLTTYPAAPRDTDNVPFPPFRPLQPARASSAPSLSAEPEPTPGPVPVLPADPPAHAAVTPAPYVSEPLPVAPMFTDSSPFPPYPPQSANPATLPREPMPTFRAQPPAAAPASADPFASLPRLRPFTDFELDSVDRDVQPRQPGPPDPGAARHSSAAALPPSGGGGRRRRTDDSDNDVLAQILAREKAAHPPQ